MNKKVSGIDSVGNSHTPPNGVSPDRESAFAFLRVFASEDAHTMERDFLPLKLKSLISYLNYCSSNFKIVFPPFCFIVATNELLKSSASQTFVIPLSTQRPNGCAQGNAALRERISWLQNGITS